MHAADRDFPGVDDDADVALGRFGRVDELAGLELDEGDVVAEPAARCLGAGSRR